MPHQLTELILIGLTNLLPFAVIAAVNGVFRLIKSNQN